MQCEEFQRFAEAYVDGEFEATERAEMSAHLGACEHCRDTAGDLGAFKQLVRSQSERDLAPEHLRASVASALARTPVSQAGHRWPYAAAVMAAAVLLLFFRFFERPGTQTLRSELVTDPILEASVDWHRAALPIEVTGPDADVIRDWFLDKVDFPVRLPQFDDSLRCSVLGGRLSHLNNRNAAHVLYEVEGAKVSVLLFAGGNLRVPARQANSEDFQFFQGNLQGYNVALFSDNGVTYTITTELPQRAFSEMVSHVDFDE